MRLDQRVVVGHIHECHPVRTEPQRPVQPQHFRLVQEVGHAVEYYAGDSWKSWWKILYFLDFEICKLVLIIMLLVGISLAGVSFFGGTRKIIE